MSVTSDLKLITGCATYRAATIKNIRVAHLLLALIHMGSIQIKRQLRTRRKVPEVAITEARAFLDLRLQTRISESM